MGRIEFSPDAKAHERTITLSTFRAGDDRIVAQGRLREMRLMEYYLFTGEKRPAGPLHDFTIRLLLAVPDLLIEEVDAEMASFPREDCPAVLDGIRKIRGMRIESGFTMKVRSMFSGIKGCTHLTHLLLAMAPAIMQGMWAVTAQKPPSERSDMSIERIASVAEGLKDSCYAWREEGRAYRRLESLIKKRG